MYVKQGQCLIINQKNYASYEDGTCRERKGTEQDEQSLIEQWQQEIKQKQK